MDWISSVKCNVRNCLLMYLFATLGGCTAFYPNGSHGFPYFPPSEMLASLAEAAKVSGLLGFGIAGAGIIGTSGVGAAGSAYYCNQPVNTWNEAAYGAWVEPLKNMNFAKRQCFAIASRKGKLKLLKERWQEALGISINGSGKSEFGSNRWKPVWVTLLSQIPLSDTDKRAVSGMINAKDAHGDTPLHQACLQNYAQVVRALLTIEGIEVNSKTKDGLAPLHIASTQGYNGIVQILLGFSGIDVNITTKEGFTPLQYASANDHVQVIQTLLAAPDIQVNIADEKGNTALHYASARGYEQAVLALLKSDELDVNAKNSEGHTPLYYAISNSNVLVVDVLLKSSKEVDWNIVYEDKAALLRDALLNHRDVVNTLLRSGKVDINKKLTRGRTLLYNAIGDDDVTLLQILLSIPETKIDVGDILLKDTPLYKASCDGKIEAVKELLKVAQSEDIDAKNGLLGRTALHCAVESGHSQVVAELLKNDKIEVNTPDQAGDTPLHLASLKLDKPMLEILLVAKGIEPNAKNNKGETPLDVVRYPENHTTLDALHIGEIKRLLIEHGAKKPSL